MSIRRPPLLRLCPHVHRRCGLPLRYAWALTLILVLSLLTACRDRDGSDPQRLKSLLPFTSQNTPAPAAESHTPQTTPEQSSDVAVDPAPTPLPSPTPPAGTITLWHSWSQADGDALALILEAFAHRYPGIQVNTLFVAYDDLLQSYAQAVSDGSGPDLVFAPNWWLSDLTTLGVVQRLDALVPAERLTSLWPAAVDNLRVDGMLYGLPLTVELVALYYNQDLVPSGALPATLDDLLAAAREQPANGIGIYANPFHLAWGFPAFGGAIFDAGGRAILDQNSGAASFLSWLASVDSLDGSYVDSDYGMLLDRYKKREFAFLVDGPWALSDLSAALGPSLGVAPIPPGPSGPSQPWLYADAVYLNPAASPTQHSLALLLAEHLTSPESGSTLVSVAAKLPASRNVLFDSAPGLAGFAEQAATAQAMPHGPQVDAFWRYGGDMVFRVLAGADAPDAIVRETTALINETPGR